MTTAQADAAFVASEVEQLLRENLTTPTCHVERMVFGNIEFARDDIYHQRIEAALSTDGQRSQRLFWLKHRPGINKLFPVLRALKQADSKIPFPDPVAGWTNGDGTSGVLVTDFARGKLLRDLVAKSMFNAALQRRLVGVFAANGAAMARFHNASPTQGEIDAQEYVSRTMGLVRENDRLGDATKSAVTAHLAQAKTLLGDTVLQLSCIHHDWTLRNILLDESNSFHIVDFDSMLAPADVAAVDVGCFLLNLESQLKWWPIARRSVLLKYWRAFQDAYQDIKSPAELQGRASIEALLYCVRVNYLIGGYFRVPLHEKFGSPMGRCFIAALTRNLMAGHSNLLG